MVSKYQRGNFLEGLIESLQEFENDVSKRRYKLTLDCQELYSSDTLELIRSTNLSGVDDYLSFEFYSTLKQKTDGTVFTIDAEATSLFGLAGLQVEILFFENTDSLGTRIEFFLKVKLPEGWDFSRAYLNFPMKLQQPKLASSISKSTVKLFFLSCEIPDLLSAESGIGRDSELYNAITLFLEGGGASLLSLALCGKDCATVFASNSTKRGLNFYGEISDSDWIPDKLFFLKKSPAYEFVAHITGECNLNEFSFRVDELISSSITDTIAQVSQKLDDADFLSQGFGKLPELLKIIEPSIMITDPFKNLFRDMPKTVSDNFKIESLTFLSGTSQFNHASEPRIEIKAEINVNSKIYHIQFIWPVNSSQLTVICQTPIQFDVGGGIKIRIDELLLGLDVPSINCLSFNMSLFFGKRLSLADKTIEFNEVGLLCTVLPEPSVVLHSIVTLGGGELSVSAPIYPSGELDTPVFSGELLAGSKISLDKLLNIIPGLPKKASSGLNILDMEFQIDQENSVYFVDIFLAADWYLSFSDGKGLALKKVHFAYEKEAMFDSTSLEANCKISEIDISLFASHSEEYGTSVWRFKGESGGDQDIPIGKLVAALSEHFGANGEIPQALESFNIKNIEVEFQVSDSDGKHCKFNCDGELTVSGNKVEANVGIDIQPTRVLFKGELIVDGMSFSLILDKNKLVDITAEGTNENGEKKISDKNEVTQWLALYHDAKGHEITISEIIQSVFHNDMDIGLTISIKDAMVAYRKQADYPDDQKEKWLFGIDIDGGFDFSALELPDLPLVGDILSPDQSLKLSLKILAASAPWNKNEISDIGALYTDGLSLPIKDIEKFDLAASVCLGKEIKPLSLPLAFNDEEGSKGLKEVPKTDTGKSEEVSTKPKPSMQASHSASNVTAEDGTQWIKVQKDFGPLHFERIGITVDGTNITALLDAGISISGLNLSLDGLSIITPLSDFKPCVSLRGLGIDYSKGTIEIGGAFLQETFSLTEDDNKVERQGYAGLAIVKTETLSLSAMGSYVQYMDHPSMFIYATLDYPLGGPGFFFVTGFAAGFGYNRDLIIPTIDNVATFPLVIDAISNDHDKGSTSADSSSPQKQKHQLMKKLHELEKHIPPSVGNIFVAAGIKFTSFKQVDSFALLVLKFGSRFEIDLLGISTLQVPPAELGGTDKSVDPVAKAELALKASFIPDEGFLGIQAQLTPNSYILSKSCHLSGGFAFFTWFDPSPHAGDFVLSLGGYHPKFVVPSHYPKVPRLAFTWQVNKKKDPYDLLIKGDLYFAMTPSTLMAGGHLEVLWHSGPLRAWFNAGIDFLICWQPYHYDVTAYVHIGGSYTFELFGTYTISIELGADLDLWGPEFSGTATLHLYICSVTVDFGDSKSRTIQPITWVEFYNAFLPKKELVCNISLQKGLIRDIENSAVAKRQRSIVNFKELLITCNSAVPITHLAHEEDKTKKSGSFGIAPLGVKSSDEIHSDFKISIKWNDLDDKDGRLIKQFKFTPIFTDVPSALWAEPSIGENGLNPPKLDDPVLVKNVVTGFEIRPATPYKEPDKEKHHSIVGNTLLYSTDRMKNAFLWNTTSLSHDNDIDMVLKDTRVTLSPFKDAQLDLLGVLGFDKNDIVIRSPMR